MTALQDEDGLRDAPWYIRAFVRLGFQTSIAAVLVWFLMTNVTGQLTRISESEMEQGRVGAVIVSNQARIIDLLAQHAQETRRNARFIEALCYNVAETVEARARCAAASTGDH